MAFLIPLIFVTTHALYCYPNTCAFHIDQSYSSSSNSKHSLSSEYVLDIVLSSI